MSDAVRLEGKPNGVASLLARVVEEKLEEGPGKRALFEKLKVNVFVHVTDMGQSATLAFDGGGVTVSTGRRGRPQLRIECDNATFVQFTMFTLLPGGIPNFFDDNGKTAAAKLLRRQLVIRGLFRHLVPLIVLLRFLAIEDEG
jgi:hypothetical protein